MDNIRIKVKAAVEKAKEIAVAQAVGTIAARLQDQNDHTGVQYALACAYGASDTCFMFAFNSINQRHMALTDMSDELIRERSYWGKELAKHIKAVAPYGYEELKEYGVMFSID